MLKLTISVTGRTESDLEDAIREVGSKFRQGFTSGADSNETGSYDFAVTGDCGEHRVETEGGDILFLSRPEVQGIVDAYNEAHEEKIELSEALDDPDCNEDNEPLQSAFNWAQENKPELIEEV
jgi:hypothetical protein